MGVHVILDIDPRGIDEAEWAASQVCRAFLENAELRAYAIGIGRDERAMREVGELADRVRAGGGSETR
ncbi:hypothetical protein [Sorangium sp. So ce542]|uniref:hypothetical protein n=1 Tax=Sorangium sp. So ce542 TaxID=3133316 RepID=UPI003F5E6DC4